MNRLNIYIGVGALLLALVGLFIWVPHDTGTGLIVRVRRQVSIGDAFAPSIAFALLAIGGAILLIEHRKRTNVELTLMQLSHSVALVGVIVLGLLFMQHAGPALLRITDLFANSNSEYRLLRETFPWKYSGFFLGGLTIVAGMATLSAGRLQARTVVIGCLVTTGFIILVDLPFEDLLLPPNGDY